MTTLVHAALTLRRTVRASYGYAAAVAFGLCDLLGVFRVEPSALRVEHAVVAGAWVVVFAARAAARARREPREATARAALDLELGLLLLVAVYAVVQLTGGLTGSFYPLVYVAVAFLASFAGKPVGAVLVLAAVAFEAGLTFVTEGRNDVRAFALHAGFIVCFGLLNLVFTHAEIARVRERGKRERDREKEKVREESRLFRLVSAPATGGGGRGDEERLFHSSVEEVHNQLYHLVEQLHRILDLHTAILLMLTEDGERLSIVELVTDSDDIADGPFPAGEGAVGAVAKRGLLTNLEHVKPGYGGLCYYRGPAVVRAFLGVPIVEQGNLRGALCIDRLEDRPFSAKEEEVLRGAVGQILRALENERVFVQLERSKREQSILYKASTELGAALDEDAVIDAALAAAAGIAPYDFAAITRYDPTQKKHTVRRAVGVGSQGFANLSFRDNTSLTAMAVKNRHYLPYRGEFDPRQQTVYTRRANLRGMEALLILPLLVREDAIGTLALAAKRADAFGESVRPTLQVLANQLAVSLANAESVRRLEEMALTDGLTGCLNKRAFLDELGAKLRAAQRFDRSLSLIVTDLDHFKSINDTYGHATGDVVLRGLGEILRKIKRETDVVARFGGEEFCLLCEETGTEGAVQLAERVREALKETAFPTEMGKLTVTCSLGVATFPEDARNEQELFQAADMALYAGKRAGRDRVMVARDAS
jgi:diguanylate cyclase (GGDEF)-like protein